MAAKQRKSLLARAQRFFFRSSMGCVSSSLGAHEEVSLVLPLSYDRCERSPSPRKQFHDEYTLKGKLGKGAFAQVHAAVKVDESSKEPDIAVKITDLRGHRKEDKEAVDPRIKRSVEKEVLILRRVGAQEYCVNFYEDYMEGPLSYIVMERCDVTLLQALERSPELTENTLVRIIREMLQGMHNVHQLGVVHRDIKPDNFLCTGEDFTVKLCDFGLAEVLSSPSTELKGVYGTAPFMSPEMLGATGYAAATDVWSLGVIAYVLLLGQFPYQPIETNAKAMKAAILAGVPAPSFRPRASLDVGGGGSRLSAPALAFLHSTLNRNKAARPTAAGALKLPWLAEPVNCDAQWSAPSLRPMLYAAKRAGAFDTRGVDANDKGNPVDTMLHSLQAKHQGATSMRLSNFTKRADKTHPELFIDMSMQKAGYKFDKFDPAMVVSSNASHISTATGSSGASYQSSRSRHAHRSALPLES
mmetsp:Transcript_45620/g.109259  ORF Transcript_45620/g.109259 Transcript_45620/m.109259 type:complete len:471 (+) Transcript_45620:42-1454(+)